MACFLNLPSSKACSWRRQPCLFWYALLGSSTYSKMFFRVTSSTTVSLRKRIYFFKHGLMFTFWKIKAGKLFERGKNFQRPKLCLLMQSHLWQINQHHHAVVKWGPSKLRKKNSTDVTAFVYTDTNTDMQTHTKSSYSFSVTF